jgi:hypothetical protein
MVGLATADVFIANFKDGKDYLLDVGVTCPTNLSVREQAAIKKNYAAEKFANSMLNIQRSRIG